VFTLKLNKRIFLHVIKNIIKIFIKIFFYGKKIRKLEREFVSNLIYLTFILIYNCKILFLNL